MGEGQAALTKAGGQRCHASWRREGRQSTRPNLKPGRVLCADPQVPWQRERHGVPKLTNQGSSGVEVCMEMTLTRDAAKEKRLA